MAQDHLGREVRELQTEAFGVVRCGDRDFHGCRQSAIRERLGEGDGLLTRAARRHLTRPVLRTVPLAESAVQLVPRGGAVDVSAPLDRAGEGHVPDARVCEQGRGRRVVEDHVQDQVVEPRGADALSALGRTAEAARAEAEAPASAWS